jgi:hypothetical protein
MSIGGSFDAHPLELPFSELALVGRWLVQVDIAVLSGAASLDGGGLGTDKGGACIMHHPATTSPPRQTIAGLPNRVAAAESRHASRRFAAR